jgi:hypothetical protein
MPPRPYFNKTTQEIAQIFIESPDSPRVLRELLIELSHRKTPSARALRRKIQSRLSTNGSNVSSREVKANLEVFALESPPSANGEVQLSDPWARSVLGVSGDASFAEIKQAWLRARDAHMKGSSSDRTQSDLDRINEAFRFLERSTGCDF